MKNYHVAFNLESLCIFLFKHGTIQAAAQSYPLCFLQISLPPLQVLQKE
jgi:hypothetical protein